MSGHYGANPYNWDGGTNAPHIARYFLASGWVMPGETIVDLGCATGYGSHVIAKHKDGKVIGIDVDEGCIIEAKGRWGTFNKTLDYRVGNLDEIEFPDADVMISIENAEHVNNLEHFVKQLKKHTKRMFIICTPIGGTSHTYTPEERLTPAGECNDFNNMAHLESVFTDKTWKLHTGFQFGYSGFIVVAKKSPKPPEGYNKDAFPKEGYVAP